MENRSGAARVLAILLVGVISFGALFGSVYFLTLSHTVTIHYSNGLMMEYNVRHRTRFEVNVMNSLNHQIDGWYIGNAPLTLGDVTVGSHIAGWYLDEGHLLPFNPELRITEDISLFPKWEVNEYVIRVVDVHNGRVENAVLPFGEAFTLGELFPDFLQPNSFFSPYFLGNGVVIGEGQLLHVSQNMIYYATFGMDFLLESEAIVPPFLQQVPCEEMWGGPWVQEFFPEDVIVRFVTDNVDAIIFGGMERFSETAHNTNYFFNLGHPDGITPLSTDGGFKVFSHWTLRLWEAGRATYDEIFEWNSGHFVDLGCLLAHEDEDINKFGTNLFHIENGVKVVTFVAVWKEVTNEMVGDILV